MSHSIDIIQEDHSTPLLHQTATIEIEDGRTVDHLIKIEEPNGRDGTHGTIELHTHDSANQIFDALFEDLDKLPIKSYTIFKVNVGLHESNPDAYTIGPYHRKNPQLRSMEKYNFLYLRRFLKRKKEVKAESCLRELDKLKDEALKCYDDIENVDSDIIEKFSEMLLLDGSFVVEYIRDKFNITWPQGEGRIIGPSSMDDQIRRDLLLLENQLPFFILAMLHNMTMCQGERSFTEQVKLTFFISLPKMTPSSFLESEGDERNIKHILQVLHMSCHPSETNPNTEVEQHSKKSLCLNPLQLLMSKFMGDDKDSLTIQHGNIPNATELHEAGVRFLKVGNIYSYMNKDKSKDPTSLFDVNFENGVMKLPCFKIYDGTESLLRNLIAYEQSGDVAPAYFSDFAIFMDYLIDSDKDVTLLRQNGIIMNEIGEDHEVASFFNKMGKGISLSSDNFYYKEVCRKAVVHCEEPWNRMKANLRHNYFNSPWAGISTVAAIILLLLTLIQTVVSIASLFKK